MHSIFINKIEELIDETESNIYEIEKLIFINRYSFTDKDFKLISKQSIVMLYSLWEGFIQDIFTIFLKEVNTCIHSIYDLQDLFLVSQVERVFPQLQNYPQKEKSKVNFHNRLQDFILSNNHELNQTVDCKNNVELEVLNFILKTYCMEEFPEDWESYSRPSRNLKNTLKDFLHFRNNQAHGNSIVADVIITHSEFQDYKKLIIDLLHEVGNRVINCIVNQDYKKI